VDEGKVKDSQLFMFNDLLVVARLKQRKQGMIAPVSGTVAASMGAHLGLACQSSRLCLLLPLLVFLCSPGALDNLLNLVQQTPAAPAAMKPSAGSTGFYFKFKDMMPLAVILLTDRKDGGASLFFFFATYTTRIAYTTKRVLTFVLQQRRTYLRSFARNSAVASRSTCSLRSRRRTRTTG
jgi:hypothetical protein